MAIAKFGGGFIQCVSFLVLLGSKSSKIKNTCICTALILEYKLGRVWNEMQNEFKKKGGKMQLKKIMIMLISTLIWLIFASLAN